MKNCSSTRVHPLRYFECSLKEKGIEVDRQRFVDYCLDQVKRNPDNVHFFENNGDCDLHIQISNSESITENFSTSLARIWSSEQKKSLDLIRQQVDVIASRNEPPIHYINRQLLNLGSLFVNCKDILQKYSACLSVLEELELKIKELVTGSDSNELDYEIVDKKQPTDFQEMLTQTLSYLNGKNEYGKRFMNDQEYTRLHDVLESLYINKAIPENCNSFHIDCEVGILKYTFYILIDFFKDNRRMYLEFLHEYISAFKSMSFDTFKTKISSPPSHLPTFLPPIFAERKMSQTNKS